MNRTYITMVVLIAACKVPPELAFTSLSGDGSISDSAPSDALSSDTSPQQPLSCMGLAMTCGPSGTGNCCDRVQTIPGGMYFRAYDEAPGFSGSMNYPATVSSFVLDKYEVTVGRFRKFAEAGQGTQLLGSPPEAGAGTHPNLPGSGWDSAWNVNLVADTAALRAAVKCGPDPMWTMWTDDPGSNEDMPMNCVTWYEAMAFCIWDGGYLPTMLELQYAASGGNEQRAYPWSMPASSTVIDCTYANYYIGDPPGMFCVNGFEGGPSPVGSTSPKGDGRWGHSDLAGNMWEWGIDWYEFVPQQPCNDCANLTPPTYAMYMSRFIGGGSFAHEAIYLRSASGDYDFPAERGVNLGIRCARTP